MISLKLLLVYCLGLNILQLKVHCTFVTSFEGRVCPGFQNISCEGESDSPSWTTFTNAMPDQQSVNGFVPLPGDFEPIFTEGTGYSGVITITFIMVQSPSMYNFSTTYSINTTVPITVICSNRSQVIGTAIIEFASAPSSPLLLRQIERNVSINLVNVTIGWDPPTDNGGRDDLAYTVTISPPAQLSATVVTSTSVTVSAADYNVDYMVTVHTTNCAGTSDPGVYRFRVDGCPLPTAPLNGLIGPVFGREAGSRVTFQCNSGFAPSQTRVATCLDTNTWSPDPATFECTPQAPVTTDSFSQSMFTGLDITLSVVVSSTLSVVIGLAIGVCVTCLLTRGRSQKDEIDHEEPPTFPPELPVRAVTATVFKPVNPAKQRPSTRSNSPDYEEVVAQTLENEMEDNYAYVRSVEY